MNEADGENMSNNNIKQANRQLLREALNSAASEGGVGGMSLGVGEVGADGAVVMGKKAPTLAELLRELAEGAEQDNKSQNNGTRFTHVTDFGQEQTGAGGSAALRSVGGGSVAATSASVAVTGEGAVAGEEVNKVSIAEAKLQKAEAEQKAREEEIEALEKSVADTEARVAGGARDIGIIKDKTRQVHTSCLSVVHCV